MKTLISEAVFRGLKLRDLDSGPATHPREAVAITELLRAPVFLFVDWACFTSVSVVQA